VPAYRAAKEPIMTHIGQAGTAAGGQTARGPKRRPRRRPGPFPVTIVRPATVTVESLTPTQRARQAEANRMAREITEASRAGTWPDLGVDMRLRLDRIPAVREIVRGIVRDASALAANPPADAVRIGRNARGRVVVIVLHAAEWSLLLCPAQPHPEVWAFLDDFGGAGIAFYGDGDLLSVQWNDMADNVFTALDT